MPSTKADRPPCPTLNCHSLTLWGHGVSSNGDRRWYCPKCKHSFTEGGQQNGGDPIGDRPLTTAERRKRYLSNPEKREKEADAQRLRRANKKLKENKDAKI